MTDKNWQKVIDECYSCLQKSKELLKVAEQEYERRYGNNPSDVDDDWWIDTLHYGNGGTDLKKIKQSAEMRK